jgi:hypothetical protein
MTKPSRSQNPIWPWPVHNQDNVDLKRHPPPRIGKYVLSIWPWPLEFQEDPEVRTRRRKPKKALTPMYSTSPTRQGVPRLLEFYGGYAPHGPTSDARIGDPGWDGTIKNQNRDELFVSSTWRFPKGMVEIFDNEKPFNNVNAITIPELEAWFIRGVRHTRQMCGITAPIDLDQDLVLYCHWFNESVSLTIPTCSNQVNYGISYCLPPPAVSLTGPIYTFLLNSAMSAPFLINAFDSIFWPIYNMLTTSIAPRFFEATKIGFSIRTLNNTKSNIRIMFY